MYDFSLAGFSPCYSRYFSDFCFVLHDETHTVSDFDPGALAGGEKKSKTDKNSKTNKEKLL